jgi:hypothetical protein
MFKIGFQQSDLISPTEPSTRIEQAIDCDGSECGCFFCEADGTPVSDLPPHYHLVESQPGAGRRTYPI